MAPYSVDAKVSPRKYFTLSSETEVDFSGIWSLKRLARIDGTIYSPQQLSNSLTLTLCPLKGFFQQKVRLIPADECNTRKRQACNILRNALEYSRLLSRVPLILSWKKPQRRRQSS